MSGFDANQVYTVSVHDPPATTSPDSPSETERLLLDFLLRYRVGGGVHLQASLPCAFPRVSNLPRTRPHDRDKLRGNLLLKQHQLEVDLRHVGLYNDELAHAIPDRPADVLPLVRVPAPLLLDSSALTISQFENAATKAARIILYPLAAGSEERTEVAAQSIPKVQVTLRSGLNMLQFRGLTADTMNKLVRIPGIVISPSRWCEKVLGDRASGEANKNCECYVPRPHQARSHSGSAHPPRDPAAYSQPFWWRRDPIREPARRRELRRETVVRCVCGCARWRKGWRQQDGRVPSWPVVVFRALTAAAGIPMTKKKFAELELSLLHLQQNVEIPETHLVIHPVIQRAVEQVPPLLPND